MYPLLDEKRTFLDASGGLLVGGLLYTYAAGTTTPKNTYTERAGTVANSNPITLNSRGEVPSGVYGTGGYKLVLKDAAEVTIWTRDEVYGAGDPDTIEPEATTSEFVSSGYTPTRIANESFTTPGDSRSVYEVGRRVRFSDSSTLYGTVTSGSYDSLNQVTTIVVDLDSGNLSAALTAADVCINTSKGGTVFTQSGTGAVARTMQDKAREVVSVKDFGAAGDGTTDDTSAIQSAIDSFGTADVRLYFPRGTYRCTGALSCTSQKSLRLDGDGIGASVLLFTSAGGLNIDFATPDSTVMEDQIAVFRDLSIQTTVAGGGTAIDVSWATAVGDTSVGLILDACYIGAQNKNSPQYWTNGVKVTNGRRVYISKCAFDGQSLTTNMARAIWLAGGTVEAHIDCCDITHCAKAINVNDECEGVFVTSTNLVYVGDGVDWQAGVAYMGTHFVLDACHISALDNAIVAARVAHGKVSDCLIQKREGTGNNYTDIKMLSDCKFWKIHNNHFQLIGTGGTEDGIVIESHAGNQYINIHDNTFENRDKAIWFKAATNNIYALNNVGVSVSTMIQNDGTDGNTYVLEGNYPATNPFKSITGATPSVDRSEAGYFILTQGGATTVTNLLHGRTGQRVLIVAGDGNSTIQHNSDVNLQGGANFAMGAGAVLELINQGSSPIWREVGRRTP